MGQWVIANIVYFVPNDIRGQHGFTNVAATNLATSPGFFVPKCVRSRTRAARVGVGLAFFATLFHGERGKISACGRATTLPRPLTKFSDTIV